MAYRFTLVHNSFRKTYDNIILYQLSIRQSRLFSYHLAARYTETLPSFVKRRCNFYFCDLIFIVHFVAKYALFFFKTLPVSVDEISVHVRVHFYGGSETFLFAEQGVFTAQEPGSLSYHWARILIIIIPSIVTEILLY